MWVQFDAEDDGIAGVPAASWTRTVEKHIEGAGSASGFTMPGAKGQNRQRGWCDPTDRSGNPRPAGFRWVEPNLPIEETELPLP